MPPRLCRHDDVNGDDTAAASAPVVVMSLVQHCTALHRRESSFIEYHSIYNPLLPLCQAQRSWGTKAQRILELSFKDNEVDKQHIMGHKKVLEIQLLLLSGQG